ncbi:MAG TPA: class I SAM-dependent methyltransferase [Thermoplasmata archaeon]|nr:class I SAM-dependent methyltransferase [Thermoplasmata archaeon]
MEAEVDPDVRWVAELAGRGRSSADRAVREASEERRLFAHLRKEHRAEGRMSYVEIDAPLELHALVRLLRPWHVVEVGVSSGVSSAYVLHALGKNGRGTLHSVDLPSRPRRSGGRATTASWSVPPGRSTGWAVPFPLRARWDLRLGDKADVVPLLVRELPRIDLLVYDVPHNERDLDREFGALDRRMRAGAVAIVDHGPGGGLCAALRRWARRRQGIPLRRQGLGLYGTRLGPRTGPSRRVARRASMRRDA